MKKMIYVIMVMVSFLLTANAFAAINNERVLAGTIKNAYVEWVSTSSVNITSGYGDCNGNYFEVPSDVTLTMNDVDGGANGDFYYIYIDDSAATYPTLDSSSDFRYDTEESSWSDSNQGWYGTTNTDDRCIGAVWVDSSDNIVKFYYILGDRIIYDAKIEALNNGVTDSTWKTLDTIDDYTPVNSVAMKILAYGYDSADAATVRVKAYEVSDEYAGGISSFGYKGWGQHNIGWIDLQRGWSRNLKYKGDTGDVDDFEIYLLGYQIER